MFQVVVCIECRAVCDSVTHCTAFNTHLHLLMKRILMLSKRTVQQYKKSMLFFSNMVAEVFKVVQDYCNYYISNQLFCTTVRFLMMGQKRPKRVATGVL